LIALREYQDDAIQAVLDAVKRIITRQLIILPTGCGKTIVFSELAKRLNKRTLVIAHREELIEQAKEKFELVWPEADLGIVMADQDDSDRQVVIASIQTAVRPRRLTALKEQDFELLIIDESHHAAADTYQKLIYELGFMEENPEKLLVGVTATAKRGDKVALGKVFQEIVYEASVGLMIRAGYLTDLKGLQISTEVDLSDIAVIGGDFNIGELANAVNTAGRNQVIVDSLLDYAPEKRAVAFCVDVQHSLDLAAMFNAAGIKAAAVYGDMEKEERREILRAFRAGEIQVLTNCNILTEGFDCPEIECLLMARPTKSQSLFIQMAGRGTRLYPGKEFCLVIDFCDSRHDVCQLGTLLGKKMKDGQTITEAIEEQEREEKLQYEAKIQEVKTREYDLLNRSRFKWMQLSNDCYRLGLGKDGYVWLRKMDFDKYKILLISGEQVVQLHEKLLPLGYSQGVAEDFARKSKSGKLADKQAQWRNLPMSDGQVQEFSRLKAEAPAGLTRGEASDMLDELKAKKLAWKFEPATPQQKARLTKMGIKYPEDLTKGQAGQLIGRSKGA